MPQFWPPSGAAEEVQLTLISGWTHLAGAALRLRRVGRVVSIVGAITQSSAGTGIQTVVSLLPAGWWSDFAPLVVYNATVGSFPMGSLTTGGALRLHGAASGQNFYFGGGWILP